MNYTSFILLFAFLSVSRTIKLSAMPAHTLTTSTTSHLVNLDMVNHQEEVHNADNVNNDIDSYIRNQIPELQTSTIINSKVDNTNNGNNYAYQYQLGNSKYTISVWDQPTDRVRQIQGISKSTTSTNSLGQAVETVSSTRLSTESFLEAAQDLFN